MSFEFKPAIRTKVGMLIGMIGGTGSGKTYSAFRLASGMSNGEKFAVIDTEAGRALHYADLFNFDHGDLKPPFRPDNYIDAIIAADKAGYPVIVVDSTSHVWSGDGGILDWQEEELQRMSGGDWQKAERVKMASWIKPKMSHKKMVQKLLQVRAHLILCFRAEEKIEMVREGGKTKIVPKQSLVGADGWIPVCEKSLPFELTASFLLLASNPGVPKPIKLQEQHRALFDLSKPITEESGKLIAEWAKGGAKKEKTTREKVDYTDELLVQLSVHNVSQADFLKKAGKKKLSEIQNFDKARSWIVANGKLTNVESEPAPENLPPPEEKEGDKEEVVMTHAEVAEIIGKATDHDLLAVAIELISTVKDSMQKVELIALSKKQAALIDNGGE